MRDGKMVRNWRSEYGCMKWENMGEMCVIAWKGENAQHWGAGHLDYSTGIGGTQCHNLDKKELLLFFIYWIDFISCSSNFACDGR